MHSNGINEAKLSLLESACYPTHYECCATLYNCRNTQNDKSSMSLIHMQMATGSKMLARLWQAYLLLQLSVVKVAVNAFTASKMHLEFVTNKSKKCSAMIRVDF